MGTYIVHYAWGSDTDIWGVLEVDQIHPLHSDFTSLRELLVLGRGEIQKIAQNPPDQGQGLKEVQLKNPLPGALRLLCLGNNWLDMGPDSSEKPSGLLPIMFYRKDESSLQGASGPVPRPEGARLIDYGVELGLIMGKSIHQPVSLTEDTVAPYIAGIVMVNDLHPRDHSLRAPGRQWYQGNSYRGMTPAGPFIYLLEAGDYVHIHNLDLKLWVNDTLRQTANTRNWARKPSEVLSRLSRVINLDVGDVILMGTPEGTAARPVSPSAKKLGGLFFSENTQTKMLIDKEARNPKYLQAGEKVKCTIASPDGLIDLGTQEYEVE